MGDFIQTKRKTRLKVKLITLRRVVITIYYPWYHSNCVRRTPLQTPTSPMLLRSLTGGVYLIIFLPSGSEATNRKLTCRLSPAADSLKGCRLRSSSSMPLNILFVRILTRLCGLVNPLRHFFQKNQSPLRCAIFLRFSQLIRADSKTSSGVESCSMIMYSIPVSRQAL